MGATPPVTRLVLAGDVMTGRGVDQVLPHPLPPLIPERSVHDARDYVRLAESVNGPVPAPVGPEWPWGEALETLHAWRSDATVMNLETAVTRAERAWRGKAVHYRMSPENVPCLQAAGVDVWTLANNHLLDYGQRGLEETLDTLRRAGLRTAGAGLDEDSAWRPAVVPLAGRRLLVWSGAAGAVRVRRPARRLRGDLRLRGVPRRPAGPVPRRRTRGHR